MQNYDFLIVGAGTAGMPCAIAAAEHGGRVLVVEKSTDVGGTLHVSSGAMSGAGTRRQRERGIEDSPDLHFEDILRISRNTVDPVLTRLAVDEAAATLDWLDELGFPFAPETPTLVYSHEPYLIPRTVWGVDLARSILTTILPVWNQHVESGRIVPLLEHRMTELLVEDGAVAGIRAQGPDDTVELRAPAVVLTSGGYGSNSGLFKELTPGSPRLVSVARETSTGDGLIAARRIGAAVRGTGTYLPTPGGVEEPTDSGRALPWPQFANLSTHERPPREIHVNARGERFRPEDDESADAIERALLRQPDHRFWIVFDERALEAGESFNRYWSIDEIRRRADEGAAVWSGDTIRELATKAGIDAEGLERTVSKWNDAVDRGDDPLGRHDLAYPVTAAPFYAALSVATTLTGQAGLAVDGDLRVLDSGDEPIPNLYAAGEVLGSEATMGDSKCGGMNLTPALSFGRIIGRRLVSAPAGAER